MIENATLISYTSPEAADGRGNKTPGTTTAYPAGTRCTVDEPRRSQTTSGTDVIVQLEATLYVLLPITPQPKLGGRVTYRADGDSEDRTLKVFKATPTSHGHQTTSNSCWRTFDVVHCRTVQGRPRSRRPRRGRPCDCRLRGLLREDHRRQPGALPGVFGRRQQPQLHRSQWEPA